MEYIIGAGAILESSGGITPATLHAEAAPGLAQRVRAAVIDFEGTPAALPARILAVVAGADAARFRKAVIAPLHEKRDCTLADILSILARAAGCAELHVFAHWLPDEETCAQLRAEAIEVVAHPLESIQAASIVSGQRLRRVA